MKRIRLKYGLRSILVATIFAAALAWWLSAPDRAARRFKDAVAGGRFEAANELLVKGCGFDGLGSSDEVTLKLRGPTKVVFAADEVESVFEQSRIVIDDLTALEVLTRYRTFRLVPNESTPHAHAGAGDLTNVTLASVTFRVHGTTIYPSFILSRLSK